MEKLCSSCLYVKPVSEFHKNVKRKDGYQYWCKSCRRLHRKNGVVVVNPNYVKPTIELVESTCELCGCIHYGEYGSGRFCSQLCARSFSSKEKREEINRKVSKSMCGRKLSEEHKASIRLACGYSRRPELQKICKFCDNPFISKRETQKYCAYQCWVDDKGDKHDAFYFYRQACKFIFNVYDYPELFDLSLLKEHGWYSASNRGGNIGGVSRDHRYSVREGFDNEVDPMVLSHPLNCKLMIHAENNRKNTECSVNLKELTEQIETFSLSRIL